MFKNVIAENFPNLRKELDIQVHETHRTPNYHNAKRSSARYITSKLSKVSDEAFREKRWSPTHVLPLGHQQISKRTSTGQGREE